MSFGTRNGFEPEKEIQINSIDDPLRNKLYNLYCEIESVCGGFLVKHLVNKLGERCYTARQDEYIVEAYILGENPNSKWYSVYDVFEYCFEYIYKSSFKRNLSGSYALVENAIERTNAILEEEKSGYRVINYEFTPITDEQEIDSISETVSNPYGAVSTHMKKALELYSDRTAPDYENSIKESISAVESMCCVITGASGSQATLGKMLKKLEEKNVTIHPSMREAFNKLYGYTSDADGIRHGGIDFSNAPAEDALYMLVSCSAFINYIKQKYESVK